MRRVEAGEPGPFETRGIVLSPGDLSLDGWPERAAGADLTTIGLHPYPVSEGESAGPGQVEALVGSPEGEEFLTRCRDLGLQVEYELHAMAELLPRELFSRDRSLFRVGEEGERTPDANLCVHSERALKIVAENAVSLATRLEPTTGQYFLWGDDARGWCQCPSCRSHSDSDQALIVENRILSALRREVDPEAQLAHLAYLNTLLPPTEIRPDPGILLEFAPIERRYDISLGLTEVDVQRRHLEALDANLDLFGRESARVLEYWLDVSLIWRRTFPERARLPFSERVLTEDLDLYGARGIRHVTTFGVCMNAEYVSRYGESPVREYGDALAKWRPG